MKPILNFVVKYPGWLVAVAAWLLYYITLAPSVLMIDTGELASAIIEPGVAHATGYPLFTLLGWLFMQLPLQPWLVESPIMQANLFAATCTAAGVGVCTQTFKLTLERILGLEAAKAAYIGGFSGLMLAVNAVVWFQGISVEVYGLHLLLLAIIVLDLLRVQHERGQKNWLYVALALALGFTNHLTTVVVLPAVLFMFLTKEGISKSSLQLLGKMLAIFAVVVGVFYATLPILASTHPLTNWGHIDSWKSFTYHVSGKQFSIFAFVKGVAVKQFKVFLGSLKGMGYLAGIFTLTGLVLIWRLNWKLAVTLSLLFLACLLWALSYDIHDIENYFLLCYFMMAMISALGLGYLHQKAKSWTSRLILAVLPLATAEAGYKNYSTCDHSQERFFEAYTREVLTSAPANAIIFSKQWDHWVASSFYYQRIEKMRPDVVVIDKELLRRTWYIKTLQDQYPWLLAPIQPEVDAYLRELERFEHSPNFDPQALEAGMQRIMRLFLYDYALKRPVFITPEIVIEDFNGGAIQVPKGIVPLPVTMGYRLYYGAYPAYESLALPKYLPTAPKGTTKYHKQAAAVASYAWLARCAYVLSLGKKEEAKAWLRIGLGISSDVNLSPELEALAKEL